METVQVPVPVQAPLQPSKVDPPSALAVRVRLEPAGRSALQLEAQSPSEELTFPRPEPAVSTTSL